MIVQLYPFWILRYKCHETSEEKSLEEKFLETVRRENENE